MNLAASNDNKDVREEGEGIDLEEIYGFALDVSKRAGQMLLDASRRRTDGASGEGGQVGATQNEKMSSVDIVTETDEQIEQFIKTTITTRYPTHSFLGEESYSKGTSKNYLISNQTPTWCVDPLDGSVNFVHLFPMICVSIAFILHGKPVIGVINAPLIPSLFSARKGHGAFLTSQQGTEHITQRLPLLSPPPPLSPAAPKGCIFSCEWGKDRRDIPMEGNMYRKAESFLNMAAELGGRKGKGGMVHGIRSLGSAALDLAYCATGAFDIWWEGGCWEWDVAAGICILEEAGGFITNGTPLSEQEMTGEKPITEVRLGGRKYLGIRAASDGVREDGTKESGREAQERVVREVWRRVVGLDYSRPGV